MKKSAINCDLWERMLIREALEYYETNLTNNSFSSSCDRQSKLALIKHIKAKYFLENPIEDLTSH